MSNDSVDRMPSAEETKQNSKNRITSSPAAQEALNREKTRPAEGEHTCASSSLDRGLLAGIHKELKKPNKKIDDPTKSGQIMPEVTSQNKKCNSQ